MAVTIRAEQETGMKAFFIFFVDNQAATTEFYSKVLLLEPTLNVPGMTEFTLPDGTKFGFMLNGGIKNLLGEKLPDPAKAAGIPRSEIYLMVNGAALYHKRAVENGAKEIQTLKAMPWGQEVAYSLDPDGHILAFAEIAEAEMESDEK
jgi:uncharacterized glyoxalase superfamily protein PhnB